MEKFPLIGCAMVLIVFFAIFALGYFVAKIGFMAFLVFFAVLGLLLLVRAM